MASSEPLTGSFTGVGMSGVIGISKRNFNVSVDGTFVATVELQRSFDGGVTWQWIKTFTSKFQGIGVEVEHGVQYRFECTSFTSGQVDYRIGIKLF